MPKYVYDIEVFPNFFCATFESVDTKEVRSFVLFDGTDETPAMKQFLSQEDLILIGYNNLEYDGAVLAAMFNTEVNIPEEIFDLSSSLISDSSRFDGRIRKIRTAKRSWKDVDLMKIMAFDGLTGLKQVGINLNWYKIQDLPLNYDATVKESDVKTILSYNLNDVQITRKLFDRIQDKIKLRKDVGELFGVDLSSASDSKMGNLILEKLYVEESGIELSKLKGLRTTHSRLLVGYCLGSGIEFKTNRLKRVKREVENTLVRQEKNFGYTKVFEFGGTSYKMGSGGLHSDDDPRKFVSDSEYIIRDCDASSYYPSMMIKNNIRPAHLGEDFTKILTKLTQERIDAKKSGNKVKAEGLKITINSIFGKLNSSTFWLEDAQALLGVTVSGQLYLLMLIESLVLAGIRVISANTDGIVSKIPRNLESSYFEVCKEWEQSTGFSLEYTDYDLYVRSDVNNYVTKKPDGKTKEKGRYLREVELNKGYIHPIVPKCMYEYFINEKPVEETLRSSHDIFDFCISQKTGSDFQLEYHKEDGSVINLQKNNRFYVSVGGGTLIKRHKVRGNEIGLMVGNKVRILNDYDDRVPFENYDINYEYYLSDVLKYIEKIKDDDYEFIPFVDDEFLEMPKSEAEEQDATDREELLNKLDGIKNLSNQVVGNLIRLQREFEGTDFLEMLIYAEDNGLVSSKFEDLILVNYFSKYGKNKRLLTIFEEFRKGKNKYTAKLTQKSKDKRMEELRKLYSELPNESLPIGHQIGANVVILGRVASTFKLNPKYVYVNKIEIKYSPKIEIYCLAKGTTATLKIRKNLFENNPINPGDIVLCKYFEKKNSVRKTESGWEDIPDKFDIWLTGYEIVNPQTLKEEE